MLAEAVGSILGDPELAAAMAEAALSEGVPEAAQRLADLVEEVAGGAQRLQSSANTIRTPLNTGTHR